MCRVPRPERKCFKSNSTLPLTKSPGTNRGLIAIAEAYASAWSPFFTERRIFLQETCILCLRLPMGQNLLRHRIQTDKPHSKLAGAESTKNSVSRLPGLNVYTNEDGFRLKDLARGRPDIRRSPSGSRLAPMHFRPDE